MSSFPDPLKQLLLEIARREIKRAVAHLDCEEVSSGNHPHIPSEGVFVTLRSKGRLLGCIGQLSSPDSLLDVVAYCARAAALADPRFEPVRVAELAEIEIELSILSSPVDITLEEIVPGKHGLVVSHGPRRGVLLPQVAVQFRWEAERFLEETCAKAGLDRHAWKDSATRIQGFTAEGFSGPVEPRTEPAVQLASKTSD